MFDGPLFSSDKLLLLPSKRLLTAEDLATLKKWQVEVVETVGRKLSEEEIERALQTMAAKKVSTRMLYGKVKDYEKKRAFEFYLDAERTIRSLAETMSTGVHVDPDKLKHLVKRQIEEIRRARDIYLNIISNDYGKDE